MMIKREPSGKRDGPLRFQERTYPGIYRIVDGGPQTFRVVCWHDPGKGPPGTNSIHADRLIRLDMPELSFVAGQPRDIEMLEPDADPVDGWVRYHTEKFSSDGMVLLSKGSNPHLREWVDVSTQRYRWVVPGHAGRE